MAKLSRRRLLQVTTQAGAVAATGGWDVPARSASHAAGATPVADESSVLDVAVIGGGVSECMSRGGSLLLRHRGGATGGGPFRTTPPCSWRPMSNTYERKANQEQNNVLLLNRNVGSCASKRFSGSRGEFPSFDPTTLHGVKLPNRMVMTR